MSALPTFKKATLSTATARRLFGTIPVFRSKSSSSKDNEIDIKKAIELLSDRKSPLLSKLSTPEITEAEKAQYISYFTKVLNTDIKPSNLNSRDYTNHFTQSLIGLNQILSSSSTNQNHRTQLIENLDSISLKDTLDKSSITNQELISRFDELINSNKLSLKTFSIIVSKINTDYETLNYINTKLDFMNRSNQYDSFKILLTSKAIQHQTKHRSSTKDQDSRMNALINDLKDNDLVKWIKLRNEFKLNKVLEKTLYQILLKLSKKSLTSLPYNNHSFVLLIESLPNQRSIITKIQDSQHTIELTKNQEALVRFITFITSHRDNFSKTDLTSVQKKLIKLSIDNQIYKESTVEKADGLTVQEYRFINGLTEVLESLQTLGFDSNDLSPLQNCLNLHSDAIYHETVVKFI